MESAVNAAIARQTIRAPLFRAHLGSVLIVASAIFLPGCSGIQSALDPAGRAAEDIAELFWGMTIGAGIIWALMVALVGYAIYSRREPHTPRQASWLIIGGGVAFPTVTLSALLIYGLALLPELIAPPPEGSLKIAVKSHQWWWRVTYFGPTGETIELANEIRLPVGEAVEFELESADVIHSFWIPSLGGKVDMIPGRKTRLVLVPTRTGLYRGVCAEFCGTSHAIMSFDVIVSEKQDFTRWLNAQSTPAAAPASEQAILGAQLFQANGCGACHAIRGTDARGVIGPDLTHAGSRRSIAAGAMKNDPQQMKHWLSKTQHLKPGVHMPSYGMLPPEHLTAIAAYLESLQ